MGTDFISFMVIAYLYTMSGWLLRGPADNSYPNTARCL